MYSDLSSYALMLGGMTILLYGLEESNKAFRRNLGSRGKELLTSMGHKKSSAFTLGVLLSAVAQSGTAATAFAVGLVDIHALPYEGSILVMMGAGVGSTLVAPLLALDVIALAPFFLALGFFLSHGKTEKLKKVGAIIKGLAFILTGMFFLKLGFAPLIETPAFGGFIAQLVTKPLLLATVACIVSSFTQGSSAVIAIGIALISSGVASAEASYPLVLGARLGTSVTVLFFSLGARVNARRLAWLSLVYRCLGVVAGIALAPFILRSVSLLIADSEMRLAAYQVGLSVLNVVVFLPFVRRSAVMSGQWFSSEIAKDPGEAIYLDESLTDFPPLAVPLLEKEITRLANYIETFIYMLFFAPDYKRQIYQLQRGIPSLLEQCSDYMFAIPAPVDNTSQMESYATISYSLISMAELVETATGKLYTLWQEGIEDRLSSELQREEWQKYLSLSVDVVRYSLRAFALDDAVSIQKALELAKEFRSRDELLRQIMVFRGHLFNCRQDAALWSLLATLRVIVAASLEVAKGGKIRERGEDGDAFWEEERARAGTDIGNDSLLK
ncbi:MAG: Na/Pi symporter [Aminobacterium sp.]|nr:Na/Pi symporter [Aminobacterium sp.]